MIGSLNKPIVRVNEQEIPIGIEETNKTIKMHLCVFLPSSSSLLFSSCSFDLVARVPMTFVLFLLPFLLLLLLPSTESNEGVFSTKKRFFYKKRVEQMFYHSYDSYLKFAYPYDELRPLTCDGFDTWGSYSLSLVDALDTLATLGNATEFNRVYHLVQNLDIERDINVSVFETNIRVIGGLLSAHLLAKRMNVSIDPTWPCSGPLLDLTVALANKILPAFETSTGIPYGTVNLFWGVPPDETNVTCTAGGGTFIVEFATLSRLTGDSRYEDAAMKALKSLWKFRSSVNLVGNHINIQTGQWTASDCTIGSGVDSYFEYLVKGSILFRQPELMEMMNEYLQSIETYLGDGTGWYVFANNDQGRKTMPLFASLDAFYPGLLTLVGKLDRARETLFAYHTMWRRYGSMPEFYNLAHQDPMQGREGYPLRPEHIESIMYLYQATHDDTFLFMAADIVDAIDSCCRTSCGFTSLKNVKDHRLDNRMESFFLAETLKYLYLIFDETNFLHSNGEFAVEHRTSSGDVCFLETSYIFNTEAHPIDVGSIDCCSTSIKTFENEKIDQNLLTKNQIRWLRNSLINRLEDKTNDTVLTCSALNFEERFSIYDIFKMLWQFVKRNRRKLFLLTLAGAGGYAALRFFVGKFSTFVAERKKLVNEWKKQLYYHHNRDMSLTTTNEMFIQVLLNINRSFQCESILQKLSSINDSTEKRQLWEELKIECFARLVTFSYSSAFVLSLTELAVSAFGGKRFYQSQHQNENQPSGAFATTMKSSHAESTQEHFRLLPRDVQMACFDVIRFTTETGLITLIDDVRRATRSIFSRLSLQDNLDVNDLIWYFSEIRHRIEKNPSSSPLLKFVRLNSLTRRPTTFNLQQQFEFECIEMIENEHFQRVLKQMVDQSFSNIFDEFAREMSKVGRPTDSMSLDDQQIPLAKIIPMSNNIYSKYANDQQQMTSHFQSLACRPELQEFTKNAYELFSNESVESASRTAFSLFPLGPSMNLTSLLQSMMSP